MGSSSDNMVITSVLTFFGLYGGYVQGDWDPEKGYDFCNPIVDETPDKQNYVLSSSAGSGLKKLWLPHIKRGFEEPNGKVKGHPGDQYLYVNPKAETGKLFIKESGWNTDSGWVGK